MIPDKITDYVSIYPNYFSDKLCRSVCKSLKKAEWSLHAYYNSKQDKHLSYENDLSVSYQNIPEREEISQGIWKALEAYILKDMSFCHDWFSGWDGYTPVRFNRYDKNTEMRIHCDHIKSMFDGNRKGIPILTVLGVFNDNYTGGELIMFRDQQVILPPGSVIVFPSNFLFPHEVRPVKKGVRYSCVSWAW